MLAPLSRDLRERIREKEKFYRVEISRCSYRRHSTYLQWSMPHERTALYACFFGAAPS